MNELKSDPQLINNPFSVKSAVGVRIGLSKDPRHNKEDQSKLISTEKLSSGNVLLYNPTDDKINYVCGSNEEKEYTTADKYDYFVSADTLNQNRSDGKTPHKDGVPYSFLQIKNELDGIEWYRVHYPKIPDELYPIIARYNWGEPITKKAVKNEKKKLTKKINQSKFSKTYGSYVIDFN
tara:strand:+ start:1687 stop:2223 length:537 start_codon:yes stop_codon:yes gene_type:complete